MALVKSTLKDAIEDILDGTTDVSDIDKASAAWAAAYKGYAAGGQDCSGATPVILSLTAAEATMTSAIKSAFQAGIGGALSPAIAVTMAAAFTAFWLTPPMTFLTTGLVTGVTGTIALAGAFQTIWLANALPGASPSAAVVAQAHADAIDAFTKTVLTSQSVIPCTGSVS